MRIDGEERSEVVNIDIVVGSRTFRAIADSGAGKSICSAEDAEMMGLVLTERQRQFRGLGSGTGTVAKPIKVTLGDGRGALVEFNVLSIKGMRICLGVEDMAKLDILVDPKMRRLRDSKTYELLSVNIDNQEKARHQPSVVSGVNEKPSDEELVLRGRNLLKTRCGKIDDDKWEALWEKFDKYRSC